MKTCVLTMLLVLCLLLCACTAPVQEPRPLPDSADTPAPDVSTVPSVTPQPAPLKTTEPETNPEPKDAEPEGMAVVVREGDTLELHIIPQLMDAFSMTEKQIKEVLGGADSVLIGSRTKGFRRMEGIIVPGSYDTAGKTLAEMVIIWITDAEKRYEALALAVSEKNSLAPHERLTLASIVAWECIGAPFEDEATAVLLNRLKKNSRLSCCGTVEYAVGYSRPYMTSADTGSTSDYNTYKKRGLPPGPICVMDDAVLKAAMAPPSDKKLYYFFYDYARGTMLFFTDYADFKAAANASKELFVQTYPDIGRHDKLDRRALFGAY